MKMPGMKMPGAQPAMQGGAQNLMQQAHHHRLQMWRNAIATQAFRFGHPQFMKAAQEITNLSPHLGTNAPPALGTQAPQPLGDANPQ